MTWEIRAGMRTSRGVRKSENEDTAAVAGLILDSDPGVGIEVAFCAKKGAAVLLADGMGGHTAGRTASRLVTQRLVADSRVITGSIPEILAAVTDAHEALYDAMNHDAALNGMGTTIVGIAIPATGRAIAFNVGDSRLLIRDSDLGTVQFSVDDAERAGTGTTSVLRQCLGGTSHLVRIEPHAVEVELREGDRLLLCSDGLTDVLSQEEIAAALTGPRSGSDVAHMLVEAARKAGAEDDTTAVVLDIGESP